MYCCSKNMKTYVFLNNNDLIKYILVLKTIYYLEITNNTHNHIYEIKILR